MRERLSDGSYLSEIEPAPLTRKKLGGQDAPPDGLSFKHSLTLMRRKLPASGAIPPRAVPEVVAEIA
ncbi:MULTISPECIES: hypothetical protein [Nitrosomonas]|uniref:hypothetical protein n=1 Tax=Nitrosomonas TaxID=914 RepID=UPI0002DC8465|nr:MULTISPECIES: hypothetical protein [Nitrosomonas]KXK39374.1 MAG: hypothetical protein UZ02_AOB001002112 [Nitrosomonas europaea]SDW94503.1 hypothetical protein SAMN05216310_16013 [Nitrosomonas europaea]SET47722.1 hypothetical protein SAMN05216309_16013 [Nitrosomonas europaea]SKA03414.1 hypothetical protein SAMN02745113_02541 [Nitrosomonas europaea]